ncbi:MAG: hypothetical protein ABW321_35135 [Polyangiales bacterium]
MFDDFGQEPAKREGRGRRSLSAVLSLGVFATLALGVGGAIAAHKVREHRAEKDVDISFEDVPKPKAPKPQVKPVAKAPSNAPRKAAARKPVVAPKSIPTETPSEAEGELAESEAAGPVDGFTDGGGDGKPVEKAPEPVVQAEAPPPPPPPPAPALQERETIVRPRFVSGCRAPDVPEALQKAAATIEIDVRMLIGADGRVSAAKVIQSHPLIPDELILSCVRAQVFEPAHLPDGTAVPFPYKRRFLFRPA